MTRNRNWSILVLVTGLCASAVSHAQLVLDPTFAPNPNGPVETIAVQSYSDSLLIGGDFNSVSGYTSTNFARLGHDGALQNPDYGDPSFNGVVHSIAVAGSGNVAGSIIVGGEFTSVWGEVRQHAVQLNPEGTLSTVFYDDPQILDGPVYAVAAQDDGKFFASGDFEHVVESAGGPTVNRMHLARFNPNNFINPPYTLDLGFGDTGNIDYGCTVGIACGGSKAVAAALDGSVYKARHWYSGVVVQKWNSTGKPTCQESAYGKASNIYAIAMQPDSKILIGGEFTEAYDSVSNAHVSRNHLARFNSNCTLDLTFGDPQFDDTVYAIALGPNGTILAGGDFTQSYDAVSKTTVPRSHLVRLNSDGTTDLSFGDADLHGGPVRAIVQQTSSQVVVGGDFTDVAGDSSHFRLVRFNNPSDISDRIFQDEFEH